MLEPKRVEVVFGRIDGLEKKKLTAFDTINKLESLLSSRFTYHYFFKIYLIDFTM